MNNLLNELEQLAHDLDDQAVFAHTHGLDPSPYREMRDKLRAMVRRYRREGDGRG